VLTPEKTDAQVAAMPGRTEAELPGHLRGDEEEGAVAGDVLPGEAPIQAALAELKKMRAGVATAPAAAATRD